VSNNKLFGNNYINAMKTTVAAFVGLAWSGVAYSAIVTTPLGLNPGDRYRLIFVTDGVRTGSSAIIADYDAFVTAEAEAMPSLAALGTTWTVVGSVVSAVGSWDAHDHTGTNPVLGSGVEIYRLDGELVASNNVDFWDGNLDVPILITPSGQSTAGSPSVWTGTNPDGTASSGFLGRNPATSADSISDFGFSDAADGSWVLGGNADNITNAYRIYGISGELVVVPEPTTGVLVLLAGIAVLQRRRRATQSPSTTRNKTEQGNR
jgi:hypothetical protein